MTHQCLVLIAHGSRLEAANEEVRNLAKKLEEKLHYPVIPAFLEIATPNIPTGIDLALEHRPEEILVFPYFLTQGRHVSEDIPKIIHRKGMENPETTIRLLPYLGSELELLHFISERIG